MNAPPQIVHLHRQAPPKPAPGAACNGCGVCCASTPCPLGMLLSGRVRGRCRLLQWNEGERRYRCGAMAAAGWRRRLAARWIAAGRGCDSWVEVEAAGDA
jgi:hypothetical protein